LNTDISQGSVVAQLRSGGIVNEEQERSGERTSAHHSALAPLAKLQWPSIDHNVRMVP